MAFEKTWRWFGPNDPYSLDEIMQTGATGLVSALHQIPIGEVWSKEEIVHRKAFIEAAGFTWSVVESVPVHEDVKRRVGNYARYIENYKQTIRNLAECDIETICYNFMPVLDWSRTNLHIRYRDGSVTSNFQQYIFAAFDLFILKRKNAAADYDAETITAAEMHFQSLNDEEIQALKETILYGFPGSLEAYSLNEFTKMLATYDEIDAAALQENLKYFLQQIVPTAEESGVFLGIHPDDPPWPLLGLPRVVSTLDNINTIINTYDSPHNGITFCTGSLGASYQNDTTKMAEELAHRVNFVHLRNVSRNDKHEFLEENHLEGDVDMYAVIKTFMLEQKKRLETSATNTAMPMRPDHGHLMIPDQDRKGIYPGYSLFGRMRGLAEITGMEQAILREINS
ncbi:mannonate dehydratase [candidate division KSB1 bacterium]|nr:mannonate dehydratase [candidate division KSB1 bacterium]